jgi:[ribosomal protein S5]-alanine N-acetyltransferase
VILETPRLLLVPQSLEIIETRLERDTFSLEIAEIGLISFTPEFPGDALGRYAGMRDYLKSGGVMSPGGVVIERSSRTAIGELGCKGEGVDGVMDIGYGFNPSAWNRGYATEIVTAFSDWLLEQAGIHAVTADTAATNPASGRVLEKAGFAQVGTGFDEEDGDLLLWRKVSASA